MYFLSWPNWMDGQLHFKWIWWTEYCFYFLFLRFVVVALIDLIFVFILWSVELNCIYVTIKYNLNIKLYMWLCDTVIYAMYIWLAYTVYVKRINERSIIMIFNVVILVVLGISTMNYCQIIISVFVHFVIIFHY